MTKKLILIVDDERLVLSSLSRGLLEEGYEPITAESGEAAMALCRQTPPDMAILDVRMPNLSGLDVAQWLRAETTIPFVFLTAYDDRTVLKQAAEHGALGYLLKPVDMPQVVAMLESALARGAEIRRLRQTETELNSALAGGREISSAVGIVMERYRLGEKEAFESLRARARQERRKLDELAKELVQAEEVLNKKLPPTTP